MTNSKYNIQNLTPWRSSWSSGKTKSIRIPIALEQEVLKYAKKLDAGTATTDDSLLQQLATEVLSDASVTRNGKDKIACRRALNAFIARLKQ